METAKPLLFPAVTVNDATTERKCDNIYGCHLCHLGRRRK